ncbi:urease accessory protein UreF [Candidatus Magnetaquicoccus inordinatus]|uniref:urease accessory protein UreF n=1 Tax=Candidatus Magnetaquicoccus inordinatus TaxID=2496818 RepID=UPI00102C3B20|nr:urease accessory protein UreF [Candidatus Magnetaquicoccus inordinatus]
MTPLAQLRLLQLSSPSLPVGAYSYSQGLEWAVEQGWVTDEESAWRWIAELLRHPLARFEAPLLAALQRALSRGEQSLWRELNEWYRASRECQEMAAESQQMGYSLLQLGVALGEERLPIEEEEVTYLLLWAWLSGCWQIEPQAAVTGYLWSWCENQVLAAVKLVPLGQTAGQRLLWRLAAEIPLLAEEALSLPQEQWNSFAPGWMIAGCGHETQYSRLFRS